MHCLFGSSHPPHPFRSFFFNCPATTEIYTLSLHDALPIYDQPPVLGARAVVLAALVPDQPGPRSEEHTSELQSRPHLVCRLLLEKKKIDHRTFFHTVVSVVLMHLQPVSPHYVLVLRPARKY